MGRPRTKRRDLPLRMQHSHGAYYHTVKGTWHPLGRDLVDALRAYHARELNALPVDELTFYALRSQYLAKGTKDLAVRTLKDYTKHSALWAEKFGHMPLGDIEAHQIKRMHREAAAARGNTQANREKSCFSLMWNWARGEGLTNLPNPCQGIKRAKETGRKVLVSDTLYRRVWVHADWPTRDAMDLARYSAQRPDDVIHARLTDIHGDELWVRQGKTDKMVRVIIAGKLARTIARIRARRYKVTSMALIRNERGEELSYSALDNRFEDARKRAGVDLNAFQFRDLRPKGLTTKSEREGKQAAQDLAGHSSVRTTEIYVQRRGKRVGPAE